MMPMVISAIMFFSAASANASGQPVPKEAFGQNPNQLKSMFVNILPTRQSLLRLRVANPVSANMTKKEKYFVEK